MSQIFNDDLDEFTRIAKAISPKEWTQFEEILSKAQGQKDKTKLVPVKKQVNRKGKVVTETFWVSPKEAENMKAGAKKEDPKQPTQDSGKIEVKDKKHLSELAKKHGLETVMNHAREQGVKWKEHDHREVNYMRSAMAINKHLQSGGKFHIDPNSKGKKKEPTNEDKENDQYKKQVQDLKDKHGKEKLLGMAKKAGVKWDEHSHDNINYMRASMAMKEHLKSGKKLEEEKKEGKKAEKPEGKKDSGETKDKKQEKPQAPADFTDKFHIRLKNKDKDGNEVKGQSAGWKESQGKKVSLGNGVTGYVHMDSNGKFVVSEQRTGTKMSGAYRTQGEAIQEAKDRIASLGSRIGGVLDNHVAKNGESPTAKTEREKAEEDRKKKDGTALQDKLKELVEKEVKKKVAEELKKKEEEEKKKAEAEAKKKAEAEAKKKADEEAKKKEEPKSSSKEPQPEDNVRLSSAVMKEIQDMNPDYKGNLSHLGIIDRLEDDGSGGTHYYVHIFSKDGKHNTKFPMRRNEFTWSRELNKKPEPKQEEPKKEAHETAKPKIGSSLEDIKKSSVVREGARDINTLFTSTNKQNDGDTILSKILAEQGFDGKPHIVTKDELDSHIKDGETEIWRGMTDGKYCDQLRDGALFAGMGIFGSGTYTTPDKTEANTYCGGTNAGKLARMSLKKDSNVITMKDLAQKMLETNDKLKDDTSEEAQSIGIMSGNLGRFAALLGYDAIHQEKHNYYIVLNRTALRIENNNYDKE